MSAPEVLAAWLDPAMLAQWVWPDLDDAVYEPPFGRGEPFRFSSERLGRVISGRCLDFNRYGFDLTWHVDDYVDGDVPQDGYDIVSVRALPADRGCELVVTHAARSNLAPQWIRAWEPALDRLASLRSPNVAEPHQAHSARRVLATSPRRA